MWPASVITVADEKCRAVLQIWHAVGGGDFIYERRNRLLHDRAIETALDEDIGCLAPAQSPLAEREASLPIALGGNIGPCLPSLCKCSYSVGIVGLVRQQDRTL